MNEKAPVPNKIVVIGSSAGGVESLSALVESLSPDLDAAVFVVQHLSPNYDSQLAKILSRRDPLKAINPADETRIERGIIYVASPDHHLLIEDGRALVKRGPKETDFVLPSTRYSDRLRTAAERK